MENIPIRFTSEEVVMELIEAGFDEDSWDLFYLPIDVSTKRNWGQCIINFRTAAHARDFAVAFHGQRFRTYVASEPLAVSPAVVQGREATFAQFAREDETHVHRWQSQPSAFDSWPNGIE